MEPNPEDWTPIPLNEEFLADQANRDDLRKQAKKDWEQVPESAASVELSFFCGNITVSSYLGAVKIAHAFDQVISLGTLEDFPDDLFSGHASRHRLKFDDVTGASPLETQDGVITPGEECIHAILNMADKNKSTLIHCKAGVSRSPAMAILLAWHWQHPLEAILTGLNQKKVYPNQLILSLGEKVLGLAQGCISEPVFERLRGGANENPALPIFRMNEHGEFKLFIEG